MPCPQRHSANTIRRPESAASRRAWLRPLTGLALAVCGLALVVAGMPGLTAPALPEHKVAPISPERGRPAGRAAMAASLRLGWSSTPLEAWSYAAETSWNVPSRSHDAGPCPATDLVASGCQASDRVARAVRGQPRERFLREGMGRDAPFPVPGWDLREVLEEMANAQHGYWPRQCLCPKIPITKGAR
jgi:hypothetical protein